MSLRVKRSCRLPKSDSRKMEEEDVKKIDAVFKSLKAEHEDEDEDAFCNFINYDEVSEPEEVEDDYILPDYQQADISKLQNYSPTALLKDDEKLIVEACSDSQLKRLLFLNRTKNVKLMQFYKKIKDLLIECQSNISAKEQQIKSTKSSKRRCRRVWRLGSPYFKTLDNFPCPRNEDTIKKDKNGELLFYEMVPSSKWNSKDTSRLHKSVIFYYKMGREIELKRHIMQLQEEIDTEVSIEKLNELKEFKARLEEISSSKIEEAPPLNCDEYIDWHRVSESFLENRHSDMECQIFWHLYKNPNIKKSKWTKEENEKLITLVEKYDCQNWEQIVIDLNSSRSSLMACMHYFMNIFKRSTKLNFTPEEDNLIFKMVDRYKNESQIPWTKIAYHLKDRTRSQVFYRWKYFLSVRNTVSRAKYTEAEDVLLMILVDKFGRRFSKMQPYFPNRSTVQLKARYSCCLRRSCKKGAFTVEEDEQIMKHVQIHGPCKWNALSLSMQRFGAQLRQRYAVLNHKLGKNPDKSLQEVAKIPRRHYHQLFSKSSFEFLRLVADKFKNVDAIPQLHDLEKIIRESSLPEPDSSQNGGEDCEVDDTSSRIMIDNMLTEFFYISSENIPGLDFKEDDLNRSVAAVTSILSMLYIDLEIPLDLENSNQLDEIDVQILTKLTESATVTDGKFVVSIPKKIISLVPPNINTLTAFAILLMNHRDPEKDGPHIFQTFKLSFDDTHVKRRVNKYLTNQPLKERQGIVRERQKFFANFLLLFKFPAVMTLQAPAREILYSCKIIQERVGPVKKTYSRKGSQLKSKQASAPAVEEVNVTESDSATVKRRRMDAESKPNLADVLKKKIADVIRGSDEGPGFKAPEFVSCGEIKIKPRKKYQRKWEVPVEPVEAATSNPDINLPHALKIEEIAPEDEDMKDLKALDVILKKEKETDYEDFGF